MTETRQFTSSGDSADQPLPIVRAQPRSFFKAPLCTDLDRLEADVAFIGVPFDQGTWGRPGARYGPDAIRDAPRAYAYVDPFGQQKEAEGFFVIESFFDDGVIEALRTECDRCVTFIDRAMDEMKVDMYGLNHRRQRYIFPQQYKKSDVLPGFLFAEPMAEICRATLGPIAYLLIEQFVVKGARCGLELGWHQDAGYIPFECGPYVTVWIALDDVDERNGTLYFLPYSRAGTRVRV